MIDLCAHVCKDRYLRRSDRTTVQLILLLSMTIGINKNDTTLRKIIASQPVVDETSSSNGTAFYFKFIWPASSVFVVVGLFMTVIIDDDNTYTTHSQPASQVSPLSPLSIHPVQDQHRASWIVRWRSSIVVSLSVWVGVVVQLGCVSCLHCQCLVCCGGPRIAKLTSVCRLFFSLIQFNTRLEMCISSFSAVCSAASN